MHLKKASLTCFQEATAPNILRLSFQVDTNCACFMHVYYNAEESFERGGALKFIGSKQIEPIPLQKGLHQKYVLAPENCIDFTKLSAKDLFLQPTAEREARRFPVVIHLVNIPSERSLKSQLNGLQSQTTFATFVKRGDSEIGIKIIKQKIQIPSAKVYELHEIYGISQLTNDAGLASMMTAADLSAESKECVICLSALKDTTVLPCRHMCMCNECAQVLRYQSSKCPICRCTVESLLQIKVSKRVPNRVPSAAQASAAASSSGSGSAPVDSAARPPTETLERS